MYPPKVKQACDGCHARKIRCDGPDVQQCYNCKVSDLECTYHAIPKKKGPKGPSKRTPKSILRMQSRMGLDQPEKLEDSIRDTTCSSSTSSQSEINTSSETSRAVFVPSALLSFEVALQYIDIFFNRIYAITPVLHREHLYSRLSSFRTSPETYALISSLCAAMVSQLQTHQPLSASSDLPFNTAESRADFFVTEVKYARSFHKYIEKPTSSDICTSFFLFSAMSNLERHNSAWFYLREAITISQLLGLGDEETYLKMNERNTAFDRRILWMLFISDRSYTLQKHRPSTLYNSIALPTIIPDDPDASILQGFCDLISLFQQFDENFVMLWNSQDLSLPNSFAQYFPDLNLRMSALQATLSTSIPKILERMEIQQSGILINCQWLKTIVWQLCLAQGLLSRYSEDDSMSFYYPITIARDAAASITLLKKESFEPYGPSILEKVFDIGCSLVDVLRLHPTTMIMTSSMEVGPRDYLMELIKLCSTGLGGSKKYFTLLMAKSEECLGVGLSATIKNAVTEVFEEDGEGEDDEDF